MHLHLNQPIALAGLASAALGVERKPPCVITPLARHNGLGEKLANGGQ